MQRWGKGGGSSNVAAEAQQVLHLQSGLQLHDLLGEALQGFCPLAARPDQVPGGLRAEGLTQPTAPCTKQQSFGECYVSIAQVLVTTLFTTMRSASSGVTGGLSL